jgi:hypothetical protein
LRSPPLKVSKRHSGSLPPPDRVSQPGPGGVVERVSCPAPSRHIPRPGDDVEAEHADVEVADPVDVGGPQMQLGVGREAGDW